MTKEDFEMEQYRALRAEILRAMEDGNQVMSFGLAAIGIVLNAGIGAKDTLLGFIMFVAVVPALSSLVLSMWFAAQERIGRASYFISGIEARMAGTLKLPGMHAWDTWLRGSGTKRTSQHHFWNTEYSGIGIFVALMVTPLLLSLLAGGDAVEMDLKYCAVGAMALALLVFFLWMQKRIRRWKGWLSHKFGDFG